MTLYIIKPLLWELLPPGRDWLAKTIIGEARVRFYEVKGWCWMFSDKTEWLPCVSDTEGKRLAEEKFRKCLVDGGAIEEAASYLAAAREVN